MSTVANDDPTRCLDKPTLLSILSNHLILQNVSPFLSARDRLALAATCQSFRELVYHTPGVFRHLDLRRVKTAQFDIDPIDSGGEVWRNVQLDENVTEDDFYSGPLRGIFQTLQRRNILKDVQTLILDGLSVTADLCSEIINDPSYNVRILSVRGAKHLNERKLRGALKYACRRTRPAGMPKLKGLYIFSSRKPGTWHGDDWYETKGRIITTTLSRAVSAEWAETMLDCQGVIAFDAVLCTGPWHLNSPAFGTVDQVANIPVSQWDVATVALAGCAGCGSAPEGMTSYAPDADAGHLPLLTPAPSLSSSLRAAARPVSALEAPSFAARCATCADNRWCQCCHKWWCEKCLKLNDAVLDQVANDIPLMNHLEGVKYGKVPISRSCIECGFSCSDCISRTQKRCSGCRAEYCIVHHEGSSSTLCDWCSSRKRTTTTVAVSKATATNSHAPGPVQQKPSGQTKDAWMAWMRQQKQMAPERAMRWPRQRVIACEVRCPSPRR